MYRFYERFIQVGKTKFNVGSKRDSIIYTRSNLAFKLNYLDLNKVRT